jgi:hypothetical protein
MAADLNASIGSAGNAHDNALTARIEALKKLRLLKRIALNAGWAILKPLF